MRIILLGCNGMLGTYINKYLSLEHDVVCLNRNRLDLSSCENEIINYFINLGDFDVIINSAGVIKQRDYDINNMIRVNSMLPHILNKVKSIKNCEVIHITTDCVFSGKSGLYNEKSEHDCLDDYGKSKSLGENNFNTNIRTSIIGEELFNKKSLLEWVRSHKKGTTINGYNNHLWNGLTCLELSKQINFIIKKKLFWQGVKHIHSPNTLTKFELVSIINDVYQLGLNINKVETKENCFRNLSSIYESNVNTDIFNQISEQKKFSI